MSALRSKVFVSLVACTACWVAMVGCGSSSASRADEKREEVSAHLPISLDLNSHYRDFATDTLVSFSSLLGANGAVLLALDQRACESCLAIDVEIRALRARSPRQSILVLTDSVNAGSVSKYLSSMRSAEKVLVVPAREMKLLNMGIEGALTTHLVDRAGRVLFSQARAPGARQELLVEDFRALESLLTDSPAQ